MPEIISRKEARALGLKRYFTGKPCRLGHVVERCIYGKICIICKHENSRRSYWKNAESRLEKGMAYRSKNRQKYLGGRRAFYENNRQKLLEKRRIYYAKNRQIENVKQREYRDRNLKEIRAKALARYYKNKPKITKQAAERRRRAYAALRALEELGIEI